MKVKKFGKEFNDVDTKTELIMLLYDYKKILSNSTISYLTSLIELEFSVVRDCIKEEDRKVLSELEIYKKVAIYNIYNRALNLFNSQNEEFIIYGNNDGKEGLTIYAKIENSNTKLFDFNYGKPIMNIDSKIPDGYKSMEVGTISLFQTIENKELRELELNRIMDKLEELYDEKCPYPSSNTYGGPAATWAFKNSQEIKNYEEKFKELDKKELTDIEKKQIEITKKYHDLLLKDYDLKAKSFKDESSDKPFICFSEENTDLNKTLVKRMPNLILKDNIKYI